MMFCPNCGTELDDESRFCHECGTPVETGEVLDSADSNSTRYVKDDIDFGDSHVQDSFDGGSSGPFSQRTTATMGSPAIRTDTMYVPQEGQQGVNFVAGAANTANTATQTNAAAQPAAGNRTTIAVAAIAVVAIAIVAIIAFVALHPQGDASKHSIQYETDGGTAIAASQVEDGAQVTSPANPTKSGYEFKGWFSDAEHTQQVTFPLTVEDDIVLYAKWEEAEAEPSSTTTSATTSADTSSTPAATTQSNNTQSSGSTVSITVQGGDGTVRTATIRRQGSTERVLPDGNSRRYSASELSGLSDAERCIAWNEIIAASNGYAFKNSGLASYFNGCSWYYRNAAAGPGGNLTAEGSANVDLLQSMTDSWWLHLATY